MEPVQTELSLTYSRGPVCTQCLSHHRPEDPNDLHHCLIDGSWFKHGETYGALRFCSTKCVRTWRKRSVTPKDADEADALYRALKQIASGSEKIW